MSPEVPGPPLECQEISEFVEPAEQTDAPSTSSPLSPTSQPGCHTSQKVKKPQREIEANPNCAGEWVLSYLQCQNGGGSSDLFSALRMSASVISKSKGWLAGKPWPSGCQLHNKKKWLVDCPTLPGHPGVNGLPSSKGVPGNHRLSVVQCEEMVTLAMALQRYAVHSGMPPGVLYRAVQELHKWLPPTLEVRSTRPGHVGHGKAGAVTPTPTESALSLRARVEEPIGILTPGNPIALEPEESTQLEEFHSCPGEDHQHPMDLPFHGQTSLTHPL